MKKIPILLSGLFVMVFVVALGSVLCVFSFCLFSLGFWPLGLIYGMMVALPILGTIIVGADIWEIVAKTK